VTGRHRTAAYRVTRRLAVGGVVLVAAAATAAGCAAPGRSSPDRTGAAATPVVATETPARAPGRTLAGLSPAPQVPVPGPATSRAAASLRPVSVRIPSIGVSSTLVPLRLDDVGVLEPPGDYVHAGWFAGGPVPGETGPAVIAGHVDSRDGPAVFFRLRELRTGDRILVARTDGRTAAFRVVEVGRYPKDAFPTERVYGPVPDVALRLITCGGDFDYARRSYRDNVVAYAVAA